MCWAANGALYFKDIYCSDWPVSQHLSQHFLNCLTSVLSLLSQISLSHVSTWWQNPKKGVELQMEHSTLKTSTAVTDLSPNIFLNTFSTVSCLYCLSFLKFHCLMSLHDGRTKKDKWYLQKCLEPQRYYSTQYLTSLLWRHLLQCHTCLLTSFSTLSQLSHICTVSPFSNFTVSCLYMMAEPKKVCWAANALLW